MMMICTRYLYDWLVLLGHVVKFCWLCWSSESFSHLTKLRQAKKLVKLLQWENYFKG